MITKIYINGFKSLVNCTMYFGPFTCIAGANAIGKSNFFDALKFLSHLADNSVLHATKSIRSEDQRHSNIEDIFYKDGDNQLKTIDFEIEMIIPDKGEDDLGQIAEAKITSLRYVLSLKLNDGEMSSEPIEIVKEELWPITQRETEKNIGFPFDKAWIRSVLKGRRAGSAFISSHDGIIKLHSDQTEKGRGGRPTEFIAKKMPRTLLSTVTAGSPTAFLARLEMRNWMMLQFEPSSLRQPSSTYEIKNSVITESGLNLPATLYRLNLQIEGYDLYQMLANKMKGLVENIKNIHVDKDDKRDLLTVQVTFKNGLTLPAQSLSDGTLRFLGLAVIQENSSNSGLICLEEPENGINPKKIDEMVDLLESMAVDTKFEVDADNPLRQVIINTHSPIVVESVHFSSLYLAKTKEIYSEELKQKITATSFSALPYTWKTLRFKVDQTSRGEIASYLEKSTEKTHSSVWLQKKAESVRSHYAKQLNLPLE